MRFALRAHKTLTPRFTDFLTNFKKKTDCFAVYFQERCGVFFLLSFDFGLTRAESKLSFVFFFSRLWIERIVSGKRRSLMCTD